MISKLPRYYDDQIVGICERSRHTLEHGADEASLG